MECSKGGLWSELPNELASMIGQRLDTRLDVLRFRSVCFAWRKSIPPPRKSPSLPLKLPFPVSPKDAIFNSHQGYFILLENTVYRFEALDDDQEASNSCSMSRKVGWLVKVQETRQGHVRLMDPLSKLSIPARLLPATFPKLLNLSLFRVYEIIKTFQIGFVESRHDKPHMSPMEIKSITFSKVLVLSPNPASTAHDYVVLGIYNGGRLCYLRLGDEKWSVIGNDNDDGGEFIYHDIVTYKGKFYAVNTYGRLVVLELYPSLKITQIASPLHYGCIGEKYLVVASSGGLLLVNKYYYNKNTRTRAACRPIPVMVANFEVYSLNEDEHIWDKVNSLCDGTMLFVGDDCCFSGLARDFGGVGCKGNCIWFFDEKYGSDIPSYRLHGDDGVSRVLANFNVGVFKLDDGSCGPLTTSLSDYSTIFWPPPTSVTAAPTTCPGSRRRRMKVCGI